MSLADTIFIENCRKILKEGFDDTNLEVRPRWSDGSPAHTKKIFGLCNRYDLRKEFPILTLRKQSIRYAVDEMLWIWQRKSNETKYLKSRVWDAWADEKGTIGKAYGYQLAQKYAFPEGFQDQVDHLRYELKHNPQSRRLVTHIFNFQDLNEMALQPCAWSMTFNVTGKYLNAVLNQRSQDMLVANGWNVMQYAVLIHMLAQEAGLEAGTLLHVIADAHIYDRHIPLVEALLDEPTYPAPTFSLDKSITNFYDFDSNSFTLENYESGCVLKNIPVAI